MRIMDTHVTIRLFDFASIQNFQSQFQIFNLIKTFFSKQYLFTEPDSSAAKL